MMIFFFLNRLTLKLNLLNNNWSIKVRIQVQKVEWWGGVGPRSSWCRGLGLKLQRSNASDKESEKNNSGPLNCMISSGTPGMLSVSSSILCVHWSVCECVRSERTERSGEGGVFEITWLIGGG